MINIVTILATITAGVELVNLLRGNKSAMTDLATAHLFTR